MQSPGRLPLEALGAIPACGYAHRKADVLNIVQSSKTQEWIDLAEAGLASEYERHHEMQYFLQSIGMRPRSSERFGVFFVALTGVMMK